MNSRDTFGYEFNTSIHQPRLYNEINGVKDLVEILAKLNFAKFVVESITRHSLRIILTIQKGRIVIHHPKDRNLISERLKMDIIEEFSNIFRFLTEFGINKITFDMFCRSSHIFEIIDILQIDEVDYSQFPLFVRRKKLLELLYTNYLEKPMSGPDYSVPTFGSLIFDPRNEEPEELFLRGGSYDGVLERVFERSPVLPNWEILTLRNIDEVYRTNDLLDWIWFDTKDYRYEDIYELLEEYNPNIITGHGLKY